MPRKKSICSVNATMQVDGHIDITCRIEGRTVLPSDIDTGHGHKLWRAVKELELSLQPRFGFAAASRRKEDV